MSVRDRKSALSEHLKRAILICDCAPGTALDEAALCARFEMSRTPVREVFRDLEGLGYVSLRENRGAHVADMSLAKLRDFFLAAPMIYAAILRLAARNASEDQLSQLREAQRQFRAALMSGLIAETALANVRFHDITGEMAGNVYLLPSFQRLLIDHARIGMTFYKPNSAHRLQTLKEASTHHDQIIDAIARGDENHAADLAELHWDLSREEIETFALPQSLDAGLGQSFSPQPREA
jgi:DNA-binding GntR family transcriptional regulator